MLDQWPTYGPKSGISDRAMLVPVVSPDTNTDRAWFSVRRVEVLRDGASAVYGADAVAGVVNTILKWRPDTAVSLQANYRASDRHQVFTATAMRQAVTASTSPMAVAI